MNRSRRKPTGLNALVLEVKKLKRLGKAALKIFISLLALWYVFHKIDYHDVVGVINDSAWWWIIPAIILYAASKWVSAYRLNEYLSCIGAAIPTIANIKLYWLGMFYNLFLPGGIGGDGYKIFYLNKKTSVATSKLFWAVLLERVNGMLFLFCLALILGYFVGFPDWYFYTAWIGVIASVLGFNTIIRYFFKQYKSVLLKTNAQSFIVQFLQILAAGCLLFSVRQYDFTGTYLFVFLVSSVVAMLPVSIGGVGAREVTFLYGAQWLGLDSDISVAISLLFYLVSLFVSLWGGFYSLFPEKIEK